MTSSIGRTQVLLRNRKPLSFTIFPGWSQEFESKFTPLEKNSLTGFTLIELLIVISILGLMAGLAVPNFGNTYSNFQLSETAKNISFLMNYAQSRAVIKGQKHQLIFKEDNSQYWLEEEISDNGEENAEGNFRQIAGRFGRVFDVPEGITIESENPSIRFYPNGKIDKIRIYLHNRHNYLTISTREQANYVQVFDFKVE